MHCFSSSLLSSPSTTSLQYGYIEAIPRGRCKISGVIPPPLVTNGNSPICTVEVHSHPALCPGRDVKHKRQMTTRLLIAASPKVQCSTCLSSSSSSKGSFQAYSRTKQKKAQLSITLDRQRGHQESSSVGKQITSLRSLIYALNTCAVQSRMHATHNTYSMACSLRRKKIVPLRLVGFLEDSARDSDK